MCLGMMLAQVGVAQESVVLISDEGVESTCAQTLYDSGGAGEGCQANENFTITFCPLEPDSTIWIEWVSVVLDDQSTITVYDGDTSMGLPLLTITGDQVFNPVQVASELNPTGCLTINFTSGPSGGSNFVANILCGQPCVNPIPVLNANVPQPHKVCVGEEVVFDATDSYTLGTFPIATWQFDLDGDGVLDEENTSGYTTFSYAEPGIYVVQMLLTDADDCPSLEQINYAVQVSTEPNWTIEPLSQSVCTNQPVDLAVAIEGVTFTLEADIDLGGDLFIPDDLSQCFSNTVEITQFPLGQTIANGNDAIEHFFMNFEHSWMQDLEISFTCPNGQSIIVHNEEGGGAFLGIPVDDDALATEQGTGWDYFWSPTATNGTWGDNAPPGGISLPEGTYEADQSFSNLDGCPLNGTWQLEICDSLPSDNGFVFDWGISFADSLYPTEVSFTPLFGLECDSTYWTTTDNSNLLLDGNWNCADVTVTNASPGLQTYTAHATNNFGCEYTQDVTVQYVQFSPYIEASSDIFCGGTAVELEVLVSAGEEGDLIVTWDSDEFLSDTTGTVVYASGMEEPETFEAAIIQLFDNYPGLSCTATADITIGTCQIKIPNVVTPYSTPGKNDDFRIEGIQTYDDVELVVLNRWGNVVFESDDFGNDVYWDCEADNASTGVYYYILTIPVDEGPLVVTDANGTLKEYTGKGPFVFEGTVNIAD